jgi:MacB-like periplasmic core domain/PQQ-like domain
LGCGCCGRIRAFVRIGANSTIFSFFNGILLRPLPYQEPERIVLLDEVSPKRGGGSLGVSFTNYLDWREQTQVFAEVGGYHSIMFTLTGAGDAEQLAGAMASAGLFNLLKVAPLLGRTFTPEEDQQRGRNVVMLGYGVWQRRFGGDPNIVGRTVTFGKGAWEVVGVMPPDFEFPVGAEFWIPLTLNTKGWPRTMHGMLTSLIFGAAPAWQAARIDVYEALGGRGGTSRRGLRHLLVVAQVALALILLVGAGLMMRSFLRLQQVRLGFNPDNVMTLRITTPGTGYKDGSGPFFERLLERVNALPGVTSAGAIAALPLTGVDDNWGIGLVAKNQTGLSFHLVHESSATSHGCAVFSTRPLRDRRNHGWLRYIFRGFMKHIRMFFALTALVGLGLTVFAQSSARDYPQWRGRNRDGSASAFVAPKTWPEKLTRRWKVEVGEGYATPIVVGGKVYVFTRRNGNETLLALNAANGKIVWQTGYLAPPLEKGSVAAKHGDGPKATPLFHQGKVYTLGLSGVVSAFDAVSGKLVWQKPAPPEAPYYGVAVSPLGDKDLIIVHPGSFGPLTAFDAKSGAVKWTATGDSAWASPIIVEPGGTRQVVSMTQKSVISVVVYEQPRADRRHAVWHVRKIERTVFRARCQNGQDALAGPAARSDEHSHRQSGRVAVFLKRQRRDDRRARQPERLRAAATLHRGRQRDVGAACDFRQTHLRQRCFFTGVVEVELKSCR